MTDFPAKLHASHARSYCRPCGAPWAIACWAIAWVCLLLCFSGCASSGWIRLRDMPRNSLTQPLQLLSRRGPQATPRTSQILRRFDLERSLKGDPKELVKQFQEIVLREPSADNVNALAEICYIGGKRAEDKGNHAYALDMYGAAVGNSYIFLLDERFDWERNPYDPQFRRACDLYNNALESVLRMVRANEKLKFEKTIRIRTATQSFNVKVVSRGDWHVDEFSRFEFVSNYELQGLTNLYQTYGLGVPLIAIHSGTHEHNRGAAFYPEELSCPVTAFLRVLPRDGTIDASAPEHQCVLEIYDSLETKDTVVNGRRVPLETDISTPLAYALNNPFFQQADKTTLGLLKPAETQSVAGVYMLQDYDPNKIPVLMVHGLWSSLTTWMEMFNDLQGSKTIRDNYQFWFYQYPTGQTFWISAAHLRQELQRIREQLDPKHEADALDEMVLVAHSMGGLISNLQVIDSEDRFWDLVSEKDFEGVEIPDTVRNYLQDTLFFEANPSIQRVVTIATPHRGSELSNSATQWLGRRLISPPKAHLDAQVILGRTGDLRENNLLDTKTSIEALSPDSPILSEIQRAKDKSHVTFHNVVGVIAETGVLRKVAGESDGVVRLTSAQLDEANSEIRVRSDHVNIHRHPRTVLEVRRILLEHLSTAGRPVPLRLPPIWRVVREPEHAGKSGY